MGSDLGAIADFGFNFNPEDYNDISGASNRQVYELPENVIEGAGLEGEWLIKKDDLIHKTNVEKHQNQMEVMVYLEANARSQDFTVPVLCGSADYEWIVTRKLQELAPGQLGQRRQRHPNKPRQFQTRPVTENIIPDEWRDLDDQTEYGFDQNSIKVLDSGMFELDGEWRVSEPFEQTYRWTHETSSRDYFCVKDSVDEYVAELSMSGETSWGRKSSI